MKEHTIKSRSPVQTLLPNEPLLEAATECLERIDLYLSSSTLFLPKWNGGTEAFLGRNALEENWSGSVLVIPPFQPVFELEDWIEKLCHEYEVLRVEQAIIFVPATPCRGWFWKLRDWAVCFLDEPDEFADGNSSGSETAAVYIGPNIDRFYSSFACFGDIYQRIEPELYFGS